MNAYESLNHTKWECKYHVVFIPKYRRKVFLLTSLPNLIGSRRWGRFGEHKWVRFGER